MSARNTSIKPPSEVDRARIEDYLEIRAQGYSIAHAAERLGISKGALERSINRCRHAGDPRLANEKPHEGYNLASGGVTTSRNTPQELDNAHRCINRLARNPSDAALLIEAVLGITSDRERTTP